MTSYVKDLGQQRFMASFVPHYAMKHVIEMKFNDEDVPGEFGVEGLGEFGRFWLAMREPIFRMKYICRIGGKDMKGERQGDRVGEGGGEEA